MRCHSWFAVGLLMVAAGALTAGTPPSSTESKYELLKRGPHFAEWRKRHPAGFSGAASPNLILLAGGMHYEDPPTRQWLPSDARFEITKNGAAVARRLAHEVTIKGDALSSATLTVRTAGTVAFQAHVLGIALFDVRTGESALIAAPRHRQGSVDAGAPQRVIFTNCFEGVWADLIYEVGPQHFAQDILLRGRLDPAEFGFEEEQCRVEVWTEILGGARPVHPAETNHAATLDFGPFLMGRGHCFQVGQEPGRTPLASVEKLWVELENRRFLVEYVHYSELAPFLAANAPVRAKNVLLAKRGAERNFPARAPGSDSAAPPHLAYRQEPEFPGVLIDYTAIFPIPGFTFERDKTYVVTGAAAFTGTAIFEGGTVIKFTDHPSAALSLYSRVYCKGRADQPAILTSVQNDGVGEAVSSFFPATPGNSFGNPALNVVTSYDELQHLQFSHLGTALRYDASGVGHKLRHAQFLNGSIAIYVSGNPYNNQEQDLSIANALFYDVDHPWDGRQYRVRAEHVTVRHAQTLARSSLNPTTLTFVNSVLAGVNSPPGISCSLSYTQLDANEDTVFAPGPGSQSYLHENSPCRNAGTTALDATLLADLKRLTTDAPRDLGTVRVTQNTSWTPIVRRDTESPDLGFHYAPVDYVADSIEITGASPVTLCLAPGTVVGLKAKGTVAIQGNGRLVSAGESKARTSLVRLAAIHGPPLAAEPSVPPQGALIQMAHNGNVPPQAEFYFTDITTLSGSMAVSVAPSFPAVFHLSAQDCQFSGALFSIPSSASAVLSLRNNIFERCSIEVTGAGALTAHNNLFWNGRLNLTRTAAGAAWVFRDNAFDGALISTPGAPLEHSHNAYLAQGTQLGAAGIGDILLQRFAYAVTPYGSYYQGGALTDKGSRGAAEAGLFHHTTSSAQIREADSIVDIGFHYPVLGTAQFSAIAKASLTAIASSEYDGWPARLAINSSLTDPGWHNRYNKEDPAWLRIDLRVSTAVAKVAYWPRQIGVNGNFEHCQVHITDSLSSNPSDWGAPVSSGLWTWSSGQESRTLEFPAKAGRFVIFRCLRGTGAWASAGEVSAFIKTGTLAPEQLGDANLNGLADPLEDSNGDGRFDSQDGKGDRDGDGWADSIDARPFDPRVHSLRVLIDTPRPGTIVH